MTGSAMGETMVRMQMYMAAERDYPADLSQLPKREDHANDTMDGWGRPLAYSVDEQGIVTLSSLGRDGLVGGEGDDADMTMRYRTRNEDGSWVIDNEYWIRDGCIEGPMAQRVQDDS